MASKRCMNAGCLAAAPGGEWRKGWGLRTGGFAMLCDKCGLAYEQHVFCDIFHQKESGWRECSYCGKRLHCGCIASRNSFDLLDSGGVQCIYCIRSSGSQFIPPQTMPKLLTSPPNRQRPFPLTIRGLTDEPLQGRSVELSAETFESGQQIKWEEKPILCLNRNPGPVGTSTQNNAESREITTDNNNNNNNSNMGCETLADAGLSISLGISNMGSKKMEGSSSVERHLMLPPPPELAGQRVRQFIPKPAKMDVGPVSQMRVARPPAEGRGRNQLLPRYWPRITDQELQQISGDSNATIVPLFEKVLSASDAGRIGRLVLPKACAEAYFPPISQPEGRPLTIQDAKGKEWHFQFRFWPNNNSRMYVLEGVTPCIQSLQLQAGDTVTFSRLEPGGKLVMGFRKATNNVTLQDSQISVIANETFINDVFFSSPGTNEILPMVSNSTGHLQSIKGGLAPALHLNPSEEGVNCWLNKTDRLGLGRSLPPPNDFMQPLQKRRIIGSKSRRLVMESEDALELKLTWEEAQDLLRPAPMSKPSIVTIEDYEFEEYDEPPIFGKRTIFTVRTSGEQDQWIRCDKCSKWRRLPVNVIVASKWICADNSWDPEHSLCSAPDELNTKEIQNLILQYEDIKRQRTTNYTFKQQNFPDLDATGLEALATAAALGDSSANGNQATASVAPTTKHPRHRPGCTCIVCIQPPSGKGPKHNPSCNCNVCMTVRRRFKTLMMRKKQKQSEREELEANKLKGSLLPLDNSSNNNNNNNSGSRESDLGGSSDFSRGIIDLNFYPAGQSRQSMMSLLEVANRPLENYLKQNGIASLACEQGGSCSTVTVPLATMESEERNSNDNGLQGASVDRERDSGVEEGGENINNNINSNSSSNNNNNNQEKVAAEA